MDELLEEAAELLKQQTQSVVCRKCRNVDWCSCEDGPDFVAMDSVWHFQARAWLESYRMLTGGGG